MARLIKLLEYAEHVKLHASLSSNSVAGFKRFVQATDGVTFIGTDAERTNPAS